ncbi:Maf family protein [Thiomicrospira sp. S5]|uniref:Maf family protein n=1 Tax=Thiomicrospira sp. S5 TaxID=1803865 RepID=UPI000F8A0BAA|nr:nucleoside triphosphate pyrophosphatase [Thiomicrospira sp. S5]AZR81842.1 septum formation inhibitor Maf [Thiomicrospira sp. S5]
MSKKVYLASSSPRRRELLEQIGVDFELVDAPVEETFLPNESPESFVIRMAVEKAFSGFNKVPEKKAWVIGSDTVVLKDGKLFGKPRHKMDAQRMMRALSDARHDVLSAVSVVYDGRILSKLSRSEVTFRAVSDAEFEAYWQTGEPEGKAGGYAIQGLGAKFISQLHGSYSGVMGLPLYELDQLLAESEFYVD